MALPLIGYFCTMVSAFAALMFVLSGVISPREMRQPHPVVSIAQSAAPETPEKKTTEEAAPVRPSIKTAAARSDAALRKKQQIARNAEKRKALALQRQNSGYPTALAFGQEFPNERGLSNRTPPPFFRF